MKMNALEMNNYLLDENEKLSKKVNEQKRKIRMMEQINKKMFRLLQETQQDVKSKEYTLKVLLGENND